MTGAAVDVRSAESAEAMVAAAIDAFGGIDILINNAAVMIDLPPYGLVEHARAGVGPGYQREPARPAAVHPGRAYRRLEARGGGRIVNGLSAGGFMPGGIYGVCKYALHGLTVNLAAELGVGASTSTASRPGLVDNESGYVSLPKDSPFREVLGAHIPGKTSGPPEDLIGTLLLLCSRAGRLDHRPDDLGRRRLDHPPLTGDRPPTQSRRAKSTMAGSQS